LHFLLDTLKLPTERHVDGEKPIVGTNVSPLQILDEDEATCVKRSTSDSRKTGPASNWVSTDNAKMCCGRHFSRLDRCR
jgi:hypothetical protein